MTTSTASTASTATQARAPFTPHTAWGTPASARYEALAAPFRPIFARIRASAVARDVARQLPHEEIAALRETGFLRVRLSAADNGSAITLPELFGLVIELGEADTNVANAVRAHLGFAEELLNTDLDTDWNQHWRTQLAQGAFIGAGLSEADSAQVGTFATTLTHEGARGWRLNGKKFYTTGSLFADWIAVAAQDGQETRSVQVPRNAAGVQVIDDWSGFGQSLTASGTALFDDAALEPLWIKPSATRFAYSVAFFQLYHLATLAGLGRALATDLAERVYSRDRVYSHGNASRVSEDPQILQVVGRAQAAAYAAGTLTLQAAQALQRAFEGQHNPNTSAQEQQFLDTQAHIEVDQAVSVITRLILDASTELFDALGASATLKSAGLDRYWRNARTLASHNPRIYRERQVGAFAVNGIAPPALYRVGAIVQPEPAASEAIPK